MYIEIIDLLSEGATKDYENLNYQTSDIEHKKKNSEKNPTCSW
jgi:hypothetical protein